MNTLIDKNEYLTEFLANTKQRAFFNLKLKEDLSTIYHNEYEFGSGRGESYWALPPAGFSVPCDYLLAIFGSRGAVAVACVEKGKEVAYSLVLNKKSTLHESISDQGYEIGVEYTGEQIAALADSLA